MTADEITEITEGKKKRNAGDLEKIEKLYVKSENTETD